MTCIEPSPALDVAAVGLSDGRVQVKHRDLAVLTLHHARSAKCQELVLDL